MLALFLLVSVLLQKVLNDESTRINTNDDTPNSRRSVVPVSEHFFSTVLKVVAFVGVVN